MKDFKCDIININKNIIQSKKYQKAQKVYFILKE